MFYVSEKMTSLECYFRTNILGVVGSVNPGLASTLKIHAGHKQMQQHDFALFSLFYYPFYVFIYVRRARIRTNNCHNILLTLLYIPTCAVLLVLIILII